MSQDHESLENLLSEDRHFLRVPSLLQLQMRSLIFMLVLKKIV
jgi:hypothetical protein